MIKLDSVSEQTEQGLKPCPFCGGEAIFLIKTYSATGFNRGWELGVSCRNCKVTTPESNYRLEVGLSDKGELLTIIDERALAIEKWNRRSDNG